MDVIGNTTEKYMICESCNGTGIKAEYRYFNNGRNKIITTRKCLICGGSGLRYIY